jgi:hypothetical protein
MRIISLAVASDGTAYVADATGPGSRGLVRRIDVRGTVSTIASVDPIGLIALDGRGSLVVASASWSTNSVSFARVSLADGSTMAAAPPALISSQNPYTQMYGSEINAMAVDPRDGTVVIGEEPIADSAMLWRVDLTAGTIEFLNDAISGRGPGALLIGADGTIYYNGGYGIGSYSSAGNSLLFGFGGLGGQPDTGGVLARDDRGVVYFVDSNTLRAIEADGSIRDIFSDAWLESVVGIEIDASGRMVLASSTELRLFQTR